MVDLFLSALENSPGIIHQPNGTSFKAQEENHYK